MGFHIRREINLAWLPSGLSRNWPTRSREESARDRDSRLFDPEGDVPYAMRAGTRPGSIIDAHGRLVCPRPLRGLGCNTTVRHALVSIHVRVNTAGGRGPWECSSSVSVAPPKTSSSLQRTPRCGRASKRARTRPLMMPRAHTNRWGSIDEEPLARLVGKRWEGGGSAGAQGPGRDLGRQGEKAREDLLRRDCAQR